MSSNPSPPNAGHPDQPSPGFMPPPGQGYLGQNPLPLPPPPLTSLTLEMYSTSYPEKSTQNRANDNEEKLRLGFIRKVNSLLMSQLLFTLGLVVGSLIIICFGAASVLIIGVTSRRFQKHELLLALGITIVLCFLLSLLAFQIPLDELILEQLYNFVWFCLIGHLIFGIITKFFLSYISIIIIYGTVGAILSSYYIYAYIYFIINAEDKYLILPIAYVLATLATSNFINIFGYIFMVIGGVNHKIS